MALTAKEMASTLIELYRSDADKKKGKYQLSKDDFKTIAGKAALKDAYFFDVDAALREDGFMLLDVRNEHNQIGVLNMSTIIKKFQELPEQVIDANKYPSEDDEWL